MVNQENLALRNRTLGILIRKARERARRTIEECADVLDVSPETYAAYEEGAAYISLPELEILGRFLDTPLRELRNGPLTPEEAEDENPDIPKAELFIPLRQRLLGVRLQQARLEAGRTLEELAAMTELPIEQLEAYEYGEEPVPLALLESLARTLGVQFDYFLERDNKVGEWHRRHEEFSQFQELPPEMREFVLKPINQSYIEVAMKLASMPAGALRQIAEGILEITF